MGDQQNTSTSTSGSANPQVTATLNKLLGGLNTAYSAGAPPVFNSSLYTPAGATTQAGWSSALTAANNPTYSGDINSAISSVGNAAAGNDYGTNDPGYAALRTKDANDASVLANSEFNNSGRLGGGSANIALGTGITNALSSLDYTNFQNDRAYQQSSAALLPQLFQSSLLPSSTEGAVGAAQDANQQGILQGNYDLSQRTNNNQTDWLAKLSSILGGQAPVAGTTTTQSTPATPWWQSLLGGGVSLAGALL